ncbi:amino acid ABC transporter substrate-binding protein [Brevibacillus fluminis]|uniref:Amino acid ABC transporter substrate-binding protein n=2 Tax=Brevibacillus fluminis TaxID=511487 RepID=A0A3M8D5G4_9BACL|nr:amino acid ABC transporter substrate-binding protein [Brevibacillus fluminis]
MTTDESHRPGGIGMKTKWLAMCGLAATLFVTACGNSASNGDGSKEGQTAQGAQQTVKVATTSDGPPFVYLNPDNNKMEGLVIDILEDIAKRENLKLDYQVMNWEAMIPSLKGGKADIIAEGMYITDERKQVINFTNPYFGYGEGLMVQGDDTSTKSLDDLKGKKVGALIGTSYQTMLEEKGKSLGIEMKVYQQFGDMMKDVDNKRLDAALFDQPILVYMKKQNPALTYRVVEDYKPSLPGEIGFGVTKSKQDVLDKLNAGIDEIKKDGTLKKIYEKWGLDWKF